MNKGMNEWTDGTLDRLINHLTLNFGVVEKNLDGWDRSVAFKGFGYFCLCTKKVHE